MSSNLISRVLESISTYYNMSRNMPDGLGLYGHDLINKISYILTCGYALIYASLATNRPVIVVTGLVWLSEK